MVDPARGTRLLKFVFQSHAVLDDFIIRSKFIDALEKFVPSFVAARSVDFCWHIYAILGDFLIVGKNFHQFKLRLIIYNNLLNLQ